MYSSQSALSIIMLSIESMRCVLYLDVDVAFAYTATLSSVYPNIGGIGGMFIAD